MTDSQVLVWAELNAAVVEAQRGAPAAADGPVTQTVQLPGGRIRTVTTERVPLRPPTDAEAEEFLRELRPRRTAT